MLHRDDIDADVAEKMIKELQEKHPGCKVVFAGDMPTNAPAYLIKKAEEMKEKLKQKAAQALIDGVCYDCGTKMPCEWPPDDEDDPNDEWTLPDGWSIYGSVGDDDCGLLICPDCDKEGFTKID